MLNNKILTDEPLNNVYLSTREKFKIGLSDLHYLFADNLPF